ncbi:heavy metal-associated isoprenylated plant protein 2-like [Nymphaea colorata]|nr:heavy metal-associated isoprenylated plant protein 2-like [Nymphaea colorata]
MCVSLIIRVVDFAAEMGANEVLKIVLKVELYCLKCKVLVMRAITKLMGIDKIEIDAEKSTVTVIGNVDPVAVVTRLKKAGKMVQIVTVGPPPKVEEKKKEEPCRLPVCCKTCERISIRVKDDRGCVIM